MDNKSTEEFFHYLSRATIIIPIVVVIAALVIKFSGGKFVRYENKLQSAHPTPVVLQTNLNKEIIKKNSTSSAQINLRGPLSCDYKTKDTSISAKIKNDKILATVSSQKEINNFLLNGDCVYIWEKDKLSGNKICQIANYISMFNSLTNNPLLGSINLFNFLPKTNGGDKFADLSQINIQTALKSCQKQDLDEDTFTLPANILFKNGL